MTRSSTNLAESSLNPLPRTSNKASAKGQIWAQSPCWVREVAAVVMVIFTTITTSLPGSKEHWHRARDLGLFFVCVKWFGWLYLSCIYVIKPFWKTSNQSCCGSHSPTLGSLAALRKLPGWDATRCSQSLWQISAIVRESWGVTWNERLNWRVYCLTRRRHRRRLCCSPLTPSHPPQPCWVCQHSWFWVHMAR